MTTKFARFGGRGIIELCANLPRTFFENIKRGFSDRLVAFS
jgi:hypothetical protein